MAKLVESAHHLANLMVAVSLRLPRGTWAERIADAIWKALPDAPALGLDYDTRVSTITAELVPTLGADKSQKRSCETCAEQLYLPAENPELDEAGCQRGYIRRYRVLRESGYLNRHYTHARPDCPFWRPRDSAPAG